MSRATPEPISCSLSHWLRHPGLPASAHRATRGILNRALFAALPKGAALINVGRGGHLVDADLIEALDTGHLSRAILDVTEPEPLPREHPFWTHPRVFLTPHVASMTQPETAAPILLENLDVISAASLR